MKQLVEEFHISGLYGLEVYSQEHKIKKYT